MHCNSTGAVYTTHQEAATALGLVDTDSEWERVIEEAAAVHGGRAIRETFASLLLHCDVKHPGEMFIKYVLVSNSSFTMYGVLSSM